MGRIKSLMVKRAAKKLIEDESLFNDSFEHNKRVLKDTMPSKPIRNKIAGYMARLIRMKNVKLAESQKPVQAAQEVQYSQ